MKSLLSFSIVLCFTLTFCYSSNNKMQLGADQTEAFLPLLKNKRVALVVNQTSCLQNGVHLLDTLLAKKVNIVKVFAPEHGFRGTADAGEQVVDGKDVKSGINLVSLYGNNKKPTSAMLQDVDILIFDIQDVGARFYTYISTMHYVMEACAENNKTLIILDRPNPHDYIDGPVLEKAYASFVGMHPIPVLHGLTIGELAKMINGERWLSNGKQCDLEIIKMQGWMHGDPYSLPIKPSPNLPNDQAIKLYASLCFFEATNISIGRGTYFPFQVIGYPDSKFGAFTFIPKTLYGFDKNPLQKDKVCYGVDLRKEQSIAGLSLKYMLDFYRTANWGASFFKSPNFMDKLSGTNKLRIQITRNTSEKEIRESWQKDLQKYRLMREKYLLYSDKL